MTPLREAVEKIADLASEHELSIATAESLTSGGIAQRLGEGPGAASWFRGGVVAYQEQVKFEVLDVREGPVVTAECAEQMARGVARLLSADATVAATGVGGPDSSEGEPPGTVYVAVVVRGEATVKRYDLEGDPEEVLAATEHHIVDLLLQTLEQSLPAQTRDG